MESFSPLGIAIVLQPDPNWRSASPRILLFCDWSVGRDNLMEKNRDRHKLLVNGMALFSFNFHRMQREIQSSLVFI